MVKQAPGREPSLAFRCEQCAYQRCSTASNRGDERYRARVVQNVGISSESLVHGDAHRGHFALECRVYALHVTYEVSDRLHAFGNLERLFAQAEQIAKRGKVQNLDHGSRA